MSRMAQRIIPLRHICLPRCGCHGQARGHGDRIAADKFRLRDDTYFLHQRLENRIVQSLFFERSQRHCSVQQCDGHHNRENCGPPSLWSEDATFQDHAQ